MMSNLNAVVQPFFFFENAEISEKQKNKIPRKIKEYLENLVEQKEFSKTFFSVYYTNVFFSIFRKIAIQLG
jgi:hypothetical protein